MIKFYAERIDDAFYFGLYFFGDIVSKSGNFRWACGIGLGRFCLGFGREKI